LNRNEIISSGLLELYATGLGSEQESNQVQQWATQYPEVAEELAQIEASIEAYSQANAIQPDASVKEKIFATINQLESAKIINISDNEAEPAKVVAISSLWKKMAAAAVLLLIGSVVENVSLYNKNKDVVSQLSNTQQTLAGLQEKNNNLSADMQVVQNKYSLPVSLTGLEAAPDAAAKIFWMKNTTGEVYIDASNLPEAPTDKQYQLWGFVDGKPVSGGMIITTQKGGKYRIQKMKTFGRAEAFAVSLEDKKDIPGEAPQGPVYVMGKM
jgi:hypothetical protein